jgi:hypothetical protein
MNKVKYSSYTAGFKLKVIEYAEETRQQSGRSWIYRVGIQCALLEEAERCKVSKAVPLRAMKAPGARGGIAPTHSQPRQ